MIKDKLHTITDEDAIKVGYILLLSSTSDMYVFIFDKITRCKYDAYEGTDAEESVNIYFTCLVKNDEYKKSGWRDEKVIIKLVESDRYHNYPYFFALYNIIDTSKKTWSYKFLSNHIEAIEFLQQKNLI